ncbi:MAG: ABC transporter ATP-binding protein [Methanomassiliicoccales archaeon]|nr:ABC transporter ATP-binding protein [Methanomassiliicoccales archaeon]
MSDNVLLEIENLYTNFYTYQGVVKALDGISFHIDKGEVFGLVGETGCGKSVTANCILRLIPSPPGKIERGRILFGMSSEIMTKKRELSEKLKSLESDGKKDGEEYKNVRTDLTKVIREYDLLSRSDSYMRKIRGKYISMIFQEPMSALNPVFTAGDQISEILVLHERKDLAKTVINNIDERLKASDSKGSMEKAAMRFFRRFYVRMQKEPDALSLRLMSRIPLLRRYERLMKKEAMKRAESMLELVRIADPANVVRSFPYELSGGMQQRVMIAMALACKPQLLIADEPTTALDVTIQAQILKIMKDLQQETGTSVLLITHNLGIIAETCDRVGVMYAGVMAEIGSVHSIFKEPLHPYTQGLMNSLPRLLATGASRLETIPGSVPNLIHPPPGCRFHPRCPYAMTVCKEKKPPMIEVKPGHFTSCYLYTEAS